MNRLISIGLSIAVAPAILLAYGKFIQSADTVHVAEIVLFGLAIPVGGVMVLCGLLWKISKSAGNSISEAASARAYLAIRHVPEVTMNMIMKVRPEALAILIALGFVMSFRTSGYTPTKQLFLNVGIALLALCGGLTIRMLFTLLNWHGAAWLIAKILAILALLFVCAVLTVFLFVITSFPQM